MSEKVPESADMQPAPFPAETIRDAAFEGKQMLYHIEAAGEEPYLRLTTYLEIDEEGVFFEFQNLDREGNAIDDAVEAYATWEELEGHATYPQHLTAVSELSLDVVAGTFECWLYEVQGDDEENELTRAYFAKKRPGPPIRFEQFAEGELSYVMELIDGHGPASEEE